MKSQKSTVLHFNLSIIETSFQRISDDIMKKVIKYLNNSESFTRMFEFSVDGIDHYFISLFRDGNLEIHFGHYKKKVFNDLWNALEKQDNDQVQKIIKEENLLMKDDLSGYSTKSLKILLSNVMTMLIKVVEKNDPADIKIMGYPNGFNFYRQFIIDHIHLLPQYYIRKYTFDDCYVEKDGQLQPAKALLLRSKLADYGKMSLHICNGHIKTKIY